MSRLIAEALEDHTEKMGCEISTQVSGQVIKEMDYLLRMKEEREDERFRRLDETIRNSQKSRKEKAVVAEYAACDPVTGWYPLELAEVDRLEKSLY